MCVLEYLTDFCIFAVTRMVAVSKLLINSDLILHGWPMFVTEATCTVVLPNGMTKDRSLVSFCCSCGFVRGSIWVTALTFSKLSLI